VRFDLRIILPVVVTLNRLAAVLRVLILGISLSLNAAAQSVRRALCLVCRTPNAKKESLLKGQGPFRR
jgi:hypothetical protein